MTEAQPSKAKAIFEKIKALFAEPAAGEQTPADERKQYNTIEGVALMIDRLEVGGSVQIADGTPAPVGMHKMEDGTVVTLDEAGMILSVEVPMVEQSETTEDDAKAQKIAELERELAALKGQGAQMSAAFSAQQSAFEARMAKQDEILKATFDFMQEVADAPGGEPIVAPAGRTAEPSKKEKAINIIAAGREAAAAKA